MEQKVSQISLDKLKEQNRNDIKAIQNNIESLLIEPKVFEYLKCCELLKEKQLFDKYGLDSIDIEYLDAIINKFNGGPVGVETISSAIGEEQSTIEDVVEPYLMQEGFIKRTPRGRVVTEKSYEHLNNLNKLI